MVSELKTETTTLKLTLNTADVEDFLAALRYLRFPISVDLPKLNGKKSTQNAVSQNRQTELSEEERLWRENQAKGQALLVQLAQMEPTTDLSDEEITELINVEIKAYHAEQIALEEAELAINH